jgi:transcriptional regulator with PAS, ATPase and Fis domain
MVDGECRGTLLVIPGTVRTRTPARAVPHEGDAARARFDAIVGTSPALLTVIDQAQRLAPLSVPVLIEGETGVGKELFARAIHGTGAVADGPFVPFNCGAVSKEMLASELFGYIRGAFTGASQDGRIGRFGLADGGTLCLDEIGELPLDLQPYLLRVLEEGIVYRVGDNVPRRVNVRLLAMTNRNLREEVAAGRFRADLYYRLSVTGLRIPPQRERAGDIDRLLVSFNDMLARRHGCAPLRFASATLEALHRHVEPDDLPEDLCAPVLAHSPMPPAAATLEATERRAIESAIAALRGNMTDAAHSLGISRSTLYRKLSQYGIERA